MAARVLVAGFCVIGLFGIVPITYQHATGIVSCPMLGFVPACYVVTLAYSLTGASMLVGAELRSALFLAGWIPIFGLALLGSSMQVLGNEACPKSVGDIPGCYLSLTLTTSLILVFLVERIYRPRTPSGAS
jgi:hypothetical protein